MSTNNLKRKQCEMTGIIEYGQKLSKKKVLVEIVYPDGRIFKGDLEGKGVEICPNGSNFNGDFKNGKKNGYGVLKFKNGDEYAGEWKDNKKDGKGRYTWKNRGSYYGEWKNNKIHGEGVETFSNGEYYIGEFSENKRHGRGLFTRPGNRKWDCVYYKGKRVKFKPAVTNKFVDIDLGYFL